MILQEEIDALRAKLKKLEAEQAQCLHDWGAPIFDPYTCGGYHADVPNVAGSGYKTWIPEQRHNQWTRTCRCCGLVQHTERTREISRPGTLPGCTATETVPAF